MNTDIKNQAIVNAFNEGMRVDKHGNIFSKTGKKLTGYVDAFGYRCITLTGPKGRTAVRLHRVIAYGIYGEDMFDSQMVVRHLDDNPENNHPSNLFLGTHSENQLDRMKRGKLHANQVKVIYNSDLSRKELAEMFSVTPGTIYSIQTGRTWSDITNHGQ